MINIFLWFGALPNKIMATTTSSGKSESPYRIHLWVFTSAWDRSPAAYSIFQFFMAFVTLLFYSLRALVDGFSLESEWQQVFPGLQDSS